jgi:hypothetical protein
MIEALEGRQLLSSSLLAPSAVEGIYKGDIAVNQIVLPIKAVVTSTKITLTVTGEGTTSIALSAKQFKKLRAGTFDFAGTVKNVKGTLLGSVTSAGKRIAGSFSGTYKTTTEAGTFILKKA